MRCNCSTSTPFKHQSGFLAGSLGLEWALRDSPSSKKMIHNKAPSRLPPSTPPTPPLPCGCPSPHPALLSRRLPVPGMGPGGGRGHRQGVGSTASLPRAPQPCQPRASSLSAPAPAQALCALWDSLGPQAWEDHRARLLCVGLGGRTHQAWRVPPQWHPSGWIKASKKGRQKWRSSVF